MKKVLIAMSGGVDSSVAAAILQGRGFSCQGAFIITHDQAQSAQTDAEKVASKLGIKIHILDWRKDFKKVLDYFRDEYKHGRTPNPCVFCNRNIKFSGIHNFAKQLGFDYIATGHYSQVFQKDGNFGLYQSAIPEKDQSYALAMINHHILKDLLLPLGDMSKEQIRTLAAEFNLGVQHKADSQEICFIPDDDYVGKLERMCPELNRQGDVVDSSGKILGSHQGIHRYTIGQRRGLRIAMGIPVYVVGLDAQKNEVVLGPKEELMHRKFFTSDANWLCDAPTEPFDALIKIRYNHRGAAGKVFVRENGGIEVEFNQAISAITPGQTAVFYVDDELGTRLLGGAWIDRTVV